MTVERICSGEVFLAAVDETAASAARRMSTHNVGMLVVVDDDKQPVGIVTDRDLCLRVVAESADPGELRVEDVMTKKPKTIPEDTPIEDALDMMRHHGVRRLPIVGRGGRLIGVVSLDDILTMLAGELEQASRLLERSLPKRPSLDLG